jgi:hypothetical protein
LLSVRLRREGAVISSAPPFQLCKSQMLIPQCQFTHLKKYHLLVLSE